MEIGVSVGPYVDRIESLPGSFEFVELAVGEGELPAAEVDPESLSARLADRGFDAVVHLPYRQPLSTPVDRIDDATSAYLDSLLALVSSTGGRKAVAHPSGRGAGRDSAALAARMEEVAAIGRSHGVTVCFETTGYAGGPSLDRVGDLAERADAAVCLDLGYAYLETGVGAVTEFLASYGDLVEHLHVHGARHRGDTHIPVGSGDVPHGRLATPLEEHTPDVTATMEVFTDQVSYLTASADRFRGALETGPDSG